MNYGQLVGYQSLTQEMVTNSTGAPVTTTLTFNNNNSRVGYGSNQYVTRKLYVNGIYIGACDPIYSATCSFPITLTPGRNTITFVDPAETTTLYQMSLRATAPYPGGVTPISTDYSNIGNWSYQLIKQ